MRRAGILQPAAMDQLPILRRPFAHAPVTQVLIFITIVCSIATLSAMPSSRDALVLDWRKLSKGLQIHRIFTCHFVFGSVGELLFGCLLLFTFRVFERQFSSKKFAAALFFFAMLSSALQILLLFLLPHQKQMTPGFAFVFALLVQYIRDIPPLTPFKVAGIPLNDKCFVYLLALQLCLVHVPVSLESAASG
eukprot:g7657.t1